VFKTEELYEVVRIIHWLIWWIWWLVKAGSGQDSVWGNNSLWSIRRRWLAGISITHFFTL